MDAEIAPTAGSVVSAISHEPSGQQKRGSSGKWSDATWTHGKQLEQLLQQVTTLRGDIASSRPMLTKGCCKGNNYEQRFALDTFPADFSWRNVLAKPCILLFTLQQDCYTRVACRLLLVVKVVFVVFPNSAGRIGNSTNPITRFSGRTKKEDFKRSPLISLAHTITTL